MDDNPNKTKMAQKQLKSNNHIIKFELGENIYHEYLNDLITKINQVPKKILYNYILLYK